METGPQDSDPSTEGDRSRAGTGLGAARTIPIHAVAGFLIGVGGFSIPRLALYASIWAALWTGLEVLGRSTRPVPPEGPTVRFHLQGFVIAFANALAFALAGHWLTRRVI